MLSLRIWFPVLDEVLPHDLDVAHVLLSQGSHVDIPRVKNGRRLCPFRSDARGLETPVKALEDRTLKMHTWNDRE